MDKLQIYYQPVQDNPDHLKSLTLSFYDFDEVAGTYKKKIVLEQNGSKYKIKNVLTNLEEIRVLIDSVDFANYTATDVNPGDPYYFIKKGDRSLATGNASSIQALLDAVHFDEILGYDISLYKKCD